MPFHNPRDVVYSDFGVMGPIPPSCQGPHLLDFSVTKAGTGRIGREAAAD